MPRVPKSIRVSDEIYALASASSAPQHRSLAQQVEHWALLGHALEAAGVTTAQAQALLGRDPSARERALLKLGLIDQASLLLFPPALARATKVAFPELAGVEMILAGGQALAFWASFYGTAEPIGMLYRQ